MSNAVFTPEGHTTFFKNGKPVHYPNNKPLYGMVVDFEKNVHRIINLATGAYVGSSDVADYAVEMCEEKNNRWFKKNGIPVNE